MIIRTPTFKDYDRIMELLIELANANPLPELQNPQYDDRYIRYILTEFVKKGVLYVAEQDNAIQGFIMGAVTPNIWLKDVLWMREVAFWVTPEYRYTPMGAKLLLQYENTCKQMMQQGVIDNFVITSLDNLGKVDYESRGYHKIETNFVWSK
jgi:N-acetylglutamate synthase-like GNAT family acetyltransferase